MTFWHLSFLHSKYSLALSGAGLSFNPTPANPGNTAGGGDSPSYSGFFHCLAIFDDRSSSCFSPGSLLLCTGSNLPFHGSLVPCSFSLSLVTTCLPVHRLRNSQGLFTCSSTHVCSLLNTTKPLHSLRLITLMFYFLDPLCLFT